MRSSSFYIHISCFFHLSLLLILIFCFHWLMTSFVRVHYAVFCSSICPEFIISISEVHRMLLIQPHCLTILGVLVIVCLQFVGHHCVSLWCDEKESKSTSAGLAVCPAIYVHSCFSRSHS
ncbi:hypothetical protein AHF37_07572 [Paragonimus kellicotti]|nr:hypothetical protein AHF37_07572 [Paragonimus kellicotti]